MNTDVANRVQSIHIEEREFTPDGETQRLKYYQLVVGISLNGEDDEIRLKLTRDQVKIFKAAKIFEEDFLDEASGATKK